MLAAADLLVHDTVTLTLAGSIQEMSDNFSLNLVSVCCYHLGQPVLCHEGYFKTTVSTAQS